MVKVLTASQGSFQVDMICLWWGWQQSPYWILPLCRDSQNLAITHIFGFDESYSRACNFRLLKFSGRTNGHMQIYQENAFMRIIKTDEHVITYNYIITQLSWLYHWAFNPEFMPNSWHRDLHLWVLYGSINNLYRLTCLDWRFNDIQCKPKRIYTLQPFFDWVQNQTTLTTSVIIPPRIYLARAHHYVISKRQIWCHVQYSYKNEHM